MPTPVGSIVNAATTLADAYIATGSIYSMVSMFVAFAVGLGLVGFIVRLVKRTAKR